MNLERFIYEINLVTTLTITDSIEWAYTLNNNIDKKIDYSNCISLYDLALLFNKLYLSYKEDYEKLPKLDLGYEHELWQYSSFDDFRKMLIYIWEPKKGVCDNYEAYLYLEEKNKDTHSYITNGLSPWKDDYFRRDIILEKDTTLNYLNFGEKHGSLIESYYFLKNKSIIGNGYTQLFSKVNGNLLESLSSFEISFGNVSLNSEDYINIVFNLGENFYIDYNSSKVVFDLTIQKEKQVLIDKMLKSIYVNINKLPEIYKSNNVKKLQYINKYTSKY